jgi:hypothetical protein
MTTQRNPNAPCPPAARFAVWPDGLARRGLLSALLAVALLLMASTLASARTVTLRWTHSNPSNVAGFVIYYGLSSANYTTVIDVPPLQPDAQGIFTFDIGVPDDATIYVTVTARDSADQESSYSNELTRRPIGQPGTPYVIPEP